MLQRIWINGTYFITTDEDGYVIDEDCLEGALGCIIKVRSDNGDGESQSIRALKVPRYLADTTRENAFIDTLLQNEFNVTKKIFSQASSGGFAGLLHAYSDATPITRVTVPAHVKHGPVDNGIEFEQGVLAFCFDKSKSPRVVCLRAKNSNGEMVPEVNSMRTLLAASPNIVEKLQNIQATDPRSQTTQIIQRDEVGADAVVFARLTSFLDNDTIESDAWYIMPPSVLYDWGQGNLQEVISRGQVTGWNFGQHLDLCLTVLSGLNTLHQKELIHGDIRPANVMHIGSHDTPARYALIDYGSFNEVPSAINAGGAGGQTLLGPSVRPERQSPFYSKERRIASEFESADTAFIVKDIPIPKSKDSDASEGILIRLGWRNSFGDLKADKNGSKDLKSSLLESLRISAQKMGDNGSENSSTELVKGDLMRLREFVFEIISTRRDGEFLDVLCRKECFRVLHDRISIPTNLDSVETGSFLAVPRVIEMRQLSCATDLYSVGVLFLYTVFCGKAFATREESEDDKTPVPKNEAIRVEKEFRELVSTLENTTYFLQLWPRISEVCKQLDICFDEGDLNLLGHKYQTVRIDRQSKDNMINVSLSSELVTLVERIAYSVPGVKRMLSVLDDNIAHFALFIRYVLCCMHRESELQNMRNYPQMPFCKNRLTDYEAKAADRAREALQRIKDVVNQKYFTPYDGHMIAVPDDIRDVKPAADLDAEVRALKKDLGKLKVRAEGLQDSIQLVHDSLAKNAIVGLLPSVSISLAELKKHVAAPDGDDS